MIGAESMTEVTLDILVPGSFIPVGGRPGTSVCVGGGGRKQIPLGQGKWLLEDKETGSQSSPASGSLCTSLLETRRWLNERIQ